MTVLGVNVLYAMISTTFPFTQFKITGCVAPVLLTKSTDSVPVLVSLVDTLGPTNVHESLYLILTCVLPVSTQISPSIKF